MNKFSDFAENEHGLDGDKLSVGEILNKEIVVKAYRIMPSKCVRDKDCLQLQFEFEGNTHIIFSNSSVLMKQIEKYADKLPFIATIKKVGSYYTFT